MSENFGKKFKKLQPEFESPKDQIFQIETKLEELMLIKKGMGEKLYNEKTNALRKQRDELIKDQNAMVHAGSDETQNVIEEITKNLPRIEPTILPPQENSNSFSLNAHEADYLKNEMEKLQKAMGDEENVQNLQSLNDSLVNKNARKDRLKKDLKNETGIKNTDQINIDHIRKTGSSAN